MARAAGRSKARAGGRSPARGIPRTTGASKTRMCVLCWTEFSESDTGKFHPLRYFEDRCFCNECLRKEKEGGWKDPKVRLK
jgi:hypothetical protein